MTTPVSHPTVSVLMPAYNAESTLEAALESAFRSTYPLHEIIVVDDGSADRTAEVADRAARSSTLVRLVRKANGGVSSALNSALSESSGDYVARLDADDLWHPEKIERQMSVAAGHPDAALIYCFVRYIDGDARVTIDGPDQRFPPRALCRLLYEGLVGGNSSSLVKRSAAIETGGWDERLASYEDLLQQMAIAARHPIACAPVYGVGYRVRLGSLSQNPRSMLANWRRLLDIVRDDYFELPRPVIRLASGQRAAHFAEAFAWQSHYAKAWKLLAEAFRDDPTGTALLLTHRAKRRLSGGRIGMSGKSAGPHFADCSLEQGVRPEAGILEPRSSAMERLHAKRTAWLAEIDRDLSARGASLRLRDSGAPENCPEAPERS